MASVPGYRSYVGGEWSAHPADGWIEVVNPATEEPFARVEAGTAADIDAAAAAARSAFGSWSSTSREQRADYLDAIAAGLAGRSREIATTITAEVGVPSKLALPLQASTPAYHFRDYARRLREPAAIEDNGTTRVVREPLGVCGLITPWNFPLHQISGKLAPALAAGCTVVLKPSEVAPLNAALLAEIVHEAGLPGGVFNLVHGEGPLVGAALAAHSGLDGVSFTGSTRAGIAVSKAAADRVKRVTLELGGKSPHLILDDADIERAATGGVRACFLNSGQACNAPSRMLVPRALESRAIEAASVAADALRVGDPAEPATQLGPLVSATQWERVQQYIRTGIGEGARVAAGGAGRPEGLDRGFYSRPTVFAEVDNAMRVAREEIFGPVLCVIPYDDEDEAVEIANDTDYGLSAQVSSGDLARARAVAARLRAGQVHLNGAPFDPDAPFGGYGMSGNGREFGRWGLEEFQETKAILGFG